MTLFYHILGQILITYIQETPFVGVNSSIDYLRFGNVEFNAKSMTLQGESQLTVLLKWLRLPMTLSWHFSC